MQADNSDFELFLETPIDLDPKLEWEAAIIDGYIPIKSDVKITTISTSSSKTVKPYWFRYIIEKGFRTTKADDYTSYEQFYYNPNEHYSHAESFINNFNEIERKTLHYGEFTTQSYPPTLEMSIENDHMVIKVIRKMDRDNECIAFMMPNEQYLEFFGGNAEFETYYRGQKLSPKRGFPSMKNSIHIFKRVRIQVPNFLRGTYYWRVSE